MTTNSVMMNTPHRSLTICLDYDDTYTTDPYFWLDFVKRTIARGHTIVVATMRYQKEGKEVELALGDLVPQIIYTNRSAKKPFLAALGITPDIWIDDTPEWILHDAKY